MRQMSKKEKKDSVDWHYEGNEEDWENFDRKVIRHTRKKLDSLGEKMWIGGVESIFAMDPARYNQHCREVMKAIYCIDPSEARKLAKDIDEFEDPHWQYDWLNRQYRLMGVSWNVVLGVWWVTQERRSWLYGGKV